MAYRRGHRFRRVHRGARRRGGARRTRSSYGSYVNMARKAFTMAKYVAGLINVEKKFCDTDLGANLNNAAWTVKPVNYVGQGDDENQRQGRSILAKNLNIRMRFNLASATDSFLHFRVCIFRDKACAGTLPSMGDLFNTITGDSAVISLRNMLTGAAQRYDVLYDKILTLDTSKSHDVVFNKYFKLNSHIHYIGTSNGTADLGNGSLFVAMISEGATGVSRVNTLGTARLRFIDN